MSCKNPPPYRKNATYRLNSLTPIDVNGVADVVHDGHHVAVNDAAHAKIDSNE